MRASSMSVGVVFIALSAAPVIAGPRTTGPKKVTTASAPKPHGAPTTARTAPAPSTRSTAGAPKAHGDAPKTHGGPPKVHGDAPKTHGSAKKSPTTTTSTTTPSATTPTTTTRVNPVAEKISSNHGLAPKVAAMLPAGMTLNQASKGFKNQGQFIAALHVSQNLGIPFADLKTAMTGIRPITRSPGATDGTTSSSGATTTTTTEPVKLLSLGQAIKKLRPGADADSAETAATRQTTTDLSSK